MVQQIAAAILGAGSVRFDLYNPDTLTWGGLGDILETDKFEVTPDSDKKEKTSKSRAAYGQSIAAVVIAKPTKIAITIGAASQEVMAMQFQGVIREDSQGAGPIDDTVVAKLEKWAKLSLRNVVTAGFAVKDAAGLITYALGTDYLVNYATGEIKPLTAGAIAANESIKVTGTALAYSSTVIRGGVRAQVRVRCVWEGENKVDSQYIECEAWEAVLTASKGFDFLASDFNGFELEGTLVVPAGKTEPYEVRFKNAA
jgi:hypothetical protein